MPHLLVPSTSTNLFYLDTHPDDANRPVMLLLQGLGFQCNAWGPAFIEAFTQRGFRCIMPDNRDIGLSQSFDHFGKPPILYVLVKTNLGFKHRPFYTIRDMACDAVGLLQALSIARAHVLGMSMGGMIAQWIAADFPDRVITLTVVMTSSGARGLPAVRGQTRRILLSKPKDASVEAFAERFVALWRTMKGSKSPSTEDAARALSMLQSSRSLRPEGTGRQMLAVICDVGVRDKALARIRCPTLVIHGKDDTLVPFENGLDVHKRVPGSRWMLVEGMGHDPLPEDQVLWLDAILAHVQS